MKKAKARDRKIPFRCFQFLLFFVVVILTFLNFRYLGKINYIDVNVNIDQTTVSSPLLSWDKNLNRSITVDILSIGSQRRRELQKRQIETFARHKTVRTFFLADERVDSDPYCSQTLTLEDTFNISRFCLEKKWKKNNLALSLMQKHFITKDRLEKNPNPVGWLCAQTRPLHALFQLQKYYQQHSLPDYLIIMDDDSYYNMEKFQNHFTLEGASRPRAIAGCRIKISLQFSVPYGGFGLIFSRSLLQLLMTPIECNDSTPNQILTSQASGKFKPPTSQDICKRLSKNRIEEYPVFQKKERAMSLVELMKDYADQSPYSDHSNWKTGYCLHSDWATGYLVSILQQEEEEEQFQSLSLIHI